MMKKIEYDLMCNPRGEILSSCNIADCPKVLNSAKKGIYRKLNLKAFEMRNSPTLAEATLWERLRNNQLGYKFRRQHLIDRFIVDFYCIKMGVVIEVDGKIHDFQRERDTDREKILQGLGCKILRFTNQEVLNNIDVVISEIISLLISPPAP